MRAVVITLLPLFLFGCAAAPTRTPPDHRQLEQLSVGMSRAEVIAVMGRRPDKVEIVRQADRRIEVLFYLAAPNLYRIGKQDMTPIYVSDGRVIAWGDRFSDSLP